jgi:hypothetical protein
MLGLILESLFLSGWEKRNLNKLLSVYLWSYLTFIPNDIHLYNFDQRITFWPVVFLIMYTFSAMVYFKDKVIPRINRTTTAIFSLGFLYWLIDCGFFKLDFQQLSLFKYVFPIVTFLVLILIFFKSLLSRKQRFWLSCWVTLITIVFTFDYSFTLISQNKLNFNESGFISVLNYLLSYFVLGMTLVYTLQHIYLLYDFIAPENPLAKSHIKNLVDTHVNRFDEGKLNTIFMFLFLGFVVFIFYVNHYYQFTSVHMVIWSIYFVYSFFEKLGKINPTKKEIPQI